MQGTEDPEHTKGYLLNCRSSGRCSHRKRKAQTNAKNTTARSASAQPDERQPQAGTVSTTREFLARRHRAELFKLLVSWVGAHSTPFCSRAPSPTTGPHGDGELFLPSIADNGSSWRREHLPCSAGSFAHHFAVSTSVDNCQRPPRAVARYVSAAEPGKVLNAEKCLEAISRRIQTSCTSQARPQTSNTNRNEGP